MTAVPQTALPYQQKHYSISWFETLRISGSQKVYKYFFHLIERLHKEAQDKKIRPFSTSFVCHRVTFLYGSSKQVPDVCVSRYALFE